MMRSEHNHPVDENSYSNFLDHAVKVRKFTKKRPKVESNCDATKTTASVCSTDSEVFGKHEKMKPNEDVEDSASEQIDDATTEEDEPQDC